MKAGWTSPEHLGISGASNGGLLVGAAMTQRPDLFRAVVCGVPLLDMVRYHMFGIGRAWIPEYGTAEDPAQLRWLHAYSPYHRVESGTRYPALLMLSADHDDRVDPLHARKFVAQLRWATASEHPVLLRIEMNAGHGGAISERSGSPAPPTSWPSCSASSKTSGTRPRFATRAAPQAGVMRRKSRPGRGRGPPPATAPTRLRHQLDPTSLRDRSSAAAGKQA